MTRSLRTRLIVGIALGLALLLGLSGVGVYELLRRAMVATVDESLIGTATMLAPLVEYDTGVVALEVGKLPEAEQGQAQNLLQIWLDDGSTIARVPASGKQDLPRFGGPLSEPQVQQFDLNPGEPVRMVGVIFTVTSTGPTQLPPRIVTLVVARPIHDLQHQLTTIRRVLLGAFAAIVAASSLVVIATVTRGLRPIRVMATQIENINDNSLHQRVDAASLPAELMPIADRLNQLLARLETAFERERGFTADAAHELRTPLAGVRTITDVTLSTAREPGDYQQALKEVRDIGLSMEAMVERLLLLARLDSGQIEVAPTAVELRKAVGSAWTLLDTRASVRGLTFENHVPAHLCSQIDPILLKMILTNLLDNAVEYSNDGGRITVGAEPNGNRVKLSISNTGCKISAADVEKVFQRFWRGDESRTAAGVRCGLGLTLVKRAIARCGGEVTAEVIADGQIFCVSMLIPREGEPRADAAN